MKAEERLIVALDVNDRNSLVSAVQDLHWFVKTFKVGFEAILAFGLKNVMEILAWHECSAFVDVKLNDIPATVGKAAAVLAKQSQVKLFNVHASAGREAMQAAADNKGDKLALAVTVLTSIDSNDAHDIFGCSKDPEHGVQLEHKVMSFAYSAYQAGLDGIICSARDLRVLNGCVFMKEMVKVTPGIRPAWAAADDQKRIVTPTQAIHMGADMLVVGRPILKPPNGMSPKQATMSILAEISEALKAKAA